MYNRQVPAHRYQVFFTIYEGDKYKTAPVIKGSEGRNNLIEKHCELC